MRTIPNKMFNSESDLTVVLTSCNRLDLLKTTLSSFFSCNTYPISEFIIIEDSGKILEKDILVCIPEQFQESVRIMINEVPLGQLASIDRAYSEIKTKYVFHCEDDWLFYRVGFIEDSMKVLENDHNILSVWLRDIHHDLIPNSNGKMHLKEMQTIENVNYFMYHYENEVGNGCFSLNPGLRYYEHYPDGGYASIARNKAKHIEVIMSEFYGSKGLYSVLLECSAVKHIGENLHVPDPFLLKSVRRRKFTIALFLLVIGFISGVILV